MRRGRLAESRAPKDMIAEYVQHFFELDSESQRAQLASLSTYASKKAATNDVGDISTCASTYARGSSTECSSSGEGASAYSTDSFSSPASPRPSRAAASPLGAFASSGLVPPSRRTPASNRQKTEVTYDLVHASVDLRQAASTLQTALGTWNDTLTQRAPTHPNPKPAALGGRMDSMEPSSWMPPPGQAAVPAPPPYRGTSLPGGTTAPAWLPDSAAMPCPQLPSAATAGARGSFPTSATVTAATAAAVAARAVGGASASMDHKLIAAAQAVTNSNNNMQAVAALKTLQQALGDLLSTLPEECQDTPPSPKTSADEQRNQVLQQHLERAGMAVHGGPPGLVAVDLGGEEMCQIMPGMEPPMPGALLVMTEAAEGQSADPENRKSRPVPKVEGGEQETLRKHLRELQQMEPNRILLVRKINRLGFQSPQKLEAYFSQFGTVSRVLIAHSHVRSQNRGVAVMRQRPSGLGFVVMSSSEEVEKIIDLGPEQVVEGASIRICRFERRGEPSLPQCDVETIL